MRTASAGTKLIAINHLLEGNQDLATLLTMF